MGWIREAHDEGLEKAAEIAERVVILDAVKGIYGVRPYGKEIAKEIRELKFRERA